MFATLIANLAIIFISIYLYFRSNYAIADIKQLSFQKWLLFICIESLVGIALVYLSWDFVGIPIDSRIIFFSISMTYFGWEITIPMYVDCRSRAYLSYRTYDYASGTHNYFSFCVVALFRSEISGKTL